jgi:hypothetical protein
MYAVDSFNLPKRTFHYRRKITKCNGHPKTWKCFANAMYEHSAPLKGTLQDRSRKDTGNILRQLRLAPQESKATLHEGLCSQLIPQLRGRLRS